MQKFRYPLSVAALMAAFAAGAPGAARAQSQGCTPNTAADWMTNAFAGNPLAQDIRPHDCDTVQQTPPDFRWPDVVSSGGYTLTLTYPDGTTHSQPTAQNWANWAAVLPAGSYRWSVTYPGGTASAARTFTVTSASQPFLVPDMPTTVGDILAKPHPRTLPGSADLSAIESQRAGAIQQLENAVSGRFNMDFPAQASSEDDVWAYSKYAIQSVTACILSSRQTSYCGDAIAKVMALGRWSTDQADPSSYHVHDMAGRYLTWVLAIGYDWLYPMLDANQRSTLLGSVGARTALMYDDLIGTRSRIAQQPRDSHRNQTLEYLPVLEGIIAGDYRTADQTWLPNTLPLALNAINPWGGEEGGFANATAQGTWDMGELEFLFYELRNMSGIDVSQKPWVKNWANWFAYFTPPGMSGGTTEFGDGYEENELEHQSRYGLGYTYFAPSPLGRWQANYLTHADPTRFEYLMAPPAGFSGMQPFPAGTPNSLYLKSVGMAAMHSDLSDPNRVSVYFKSSPPPYGAYNHSHPDQNGFVVNAGGQRLAIESGYYDNYKTDHWWNWYHQTRSKNAITYDGGRGQQFYDAGNLMVYGRTTGFTTTAGYDVVSGDATNAYAGVLSLAVRSLVYLRPNLIVVYDDVAAPAPHSWEWNIHALNQMTNTSASTAQITAGNQTMCVTMLAAPNGTQFSQTNRFTKDPVGITWAPQWHGKFYTGSLPGAEFIALMNVGCTPVNASATKSNGVWSVAVGGATIAITGGGGPISVTGAGTSTTTTSGTSSGTTTGVTTTTGTPARTATGTTTGAAAYAGKPFSGTPISVPSTFMAASFDVGGQNVAYYDTTSANVGGQYRPSEAVDIIASCDPTPSARYVVNNFATGEWMNYTINVPATGNYLVQLNASNDSARSGAFHVEVDGARVAGPVPVPTTGGWCVFHPVATPAFRMTAGTHVLRIQSDRQFFNIETVDVIGSP
ncbi:MAG TPA: heparinase II/III family protein [Rhodocyclaceae bacterium]